MCDRSLLPEGFSSYLGRTESGLAGFWFNGSTMIPFETQVSLFVLLPTLFTSSIMHRGRSAEH